MLRLYQSCLPTRVYKAPVGAHWVSEIKLDASASSHGRPARMSFCRPRKATTTPTDIPGSWKPSNGCAPARSSSMARRCAAISFDDLWSRAADEHVRLCAFDLLEIDGEDFRDKPLKERKRRLA